MTATDADFRHAAGATLAAALQASRRDTLATFAVFEAVLGGAGLRVPQRAELNPPLWELGHIGWFQEWWLARNPATERTRGAAANPFAARLPGLRANADALYDSSHVPHATRWQLPLPTAEQTRQELAQQLQHTLALLAECGPETGTAIGGLTDKRAATPSALQADGRADQRANDAALYFFRLALAHEDMHHEAALWMAQALGLPIADARWQPLPLPAPAEPLRFEAGHLNLGLPSGQCFVFDNECGAHSVAVPAFEIDAQVVRWLDYLPMVQAGAAGVPRYVRRTLRGDSGGGGGDGAGHQASDSGWEVERYGIWQALDLALPVCHVTALEAQAWCEWTGRRLPTEAEWQRAATEHPERFTWGAVWEWTATDFAPYPGFQPHPYRDYSAPWFGGSHRVLRGACFATQPRLRSPRYRNFFAPGRNDVFAGFRSCAL